MPTAKKKPLNLYCVDWEMTGTIEIAASSRDEAQDKFDAMFANGTPSNIDGEIANTPPYLKVED